MELRLAVEAGDLPALKQAARDLEGDEEDAGTLHGALGYAQVVEDQEEAAYAAARIAEACGQCHTSRSVGLSTELRLGHHAEVSETLWDTMIVGDETGAAAAVLAWDRGALSGDPLVDVLSSCTGCHPFEGAAP